jgi:hypothetical protein
MQYNLPVMEIQVGEGEGENECNLSPTSMISFKEQSFII